MTSAHFECIPSELYRDMFKYLDPSSLVSLYRATNHSSIKAESRHAFLNTNTETIKKLIEQDNINSLKRLFKYFYDTKNINILQEIYEYSIKHNADKITKFMQDHVHELDVNVVIDGNTPIQYFIEYDKIVLTKSVVKHPNFQPNKDAVLINAHGEHAVELLKHPSIDCNIEKYQQTPLVAGIGNIDVKKVHALMNHPKIKPNKKVIDNKTALHVACQLYSYYQQENVKKIINRLIQHPKTKPNLKTLQGETPLHIAIDTEQDISIVNILLNHPKTKLHAKTRPTWTQTGEYIPGKTPLEYALHLNIDKNILKKLS